MKNRKLNQWLWKWHFIAGIISLPFVLILSITGAVYLFKPDVEKEAISKIQKIINVKNGSEKLSYQKQWNIAKSNTKRKLNSIILSEEDKSTEFISGRFGGKQSLYINPYSGEISGTFKAKDTWMYTVRKLHGELLGGKVGTKFVELMASWMVVLILTGLYIWFPFVKGIKGVFTIRFREGKRILFRDIHAVTGFWMSILLLIVLAGGFPWTDVFGGNFKWVQKATNTGYPKTWSGRGLSSIPSDKQLSLDEMISVANHQNLKGVISIGLPKSPKSTFSVSNNTFPLTEQKMLHFDQYSGELVKAHNWSDVGVLMKARIWLMAFHQGQFGGWNWYLLFFIAIALTVMSFGAIFSYVLRKQKGKWNVPKSPINMKVGKAIVFFLMLLSIVFPLFGISLLIILMYEFFKSKKRIIV